MGPSNYGSEQSSASCESAVFFFMLVLFSSIQQPFPAPIFQVHVLLILLFFLSSMDLTEQFNQWSTSWIIITQYIYIEEYLGTYCYPIIYIYVSFLFLFQIIIAPAHMAYFTWGMGAADAAVPKILGKHVIDVMPCPQYRFQVLSYAHNCIYTYYYLGIYFSAQCCYSSFSSSMNEFCDLFLLPRKIYIYILSIILSIIVMFNVYLAFIYTPNTTIFYMSVCVCVSIYIVSRSQICEVAHS